MQCRPIKKQACFTHNSVILIQQTPNTTCPQVTAFRISTFFFFFVRQLNHLPILRYKNPINVCLTFTIQDEIFSTLVGPKFKRTNIRNQFNRSVVKWIERLLLKW